MYISIHKYQRLVSLCGATDQNEVPFSYAKNKESKYKHIQYM